MAAELEARKCFPIMPDEVFDIWISQHIRFSGWPFTGQETSISDPTWAKYFRDRPIPFWARVNWVRISPPFNKVKIERRAIDVCKRLAEIGKKYITTGIAEQTLVKDTPQKVSALAAEIRRTGKFPVPIVSLAFNDELLLLDGHHRLAAMFLHDESGIFQFDSWVGEHAL